MNELIDNVFGFCCLTITEIGRIFGLSYEAINVISFCYVEPIFTGTMLLLAILSCLGFPVRKMGTFFFYSVVGCVTTLLLLGALNAIKDAMIYQNNLSRLWNDVSGGETNQTIIDKFNDTVNWLNNASHTLHVSYEMINLIVYVFSMPFISLICYIFVRRNKRKISDTPNI